MPGAYLRVVVKPGQRTILNIIIDQGETYEEVGKPTVITNLATDVTTELEKMQKQIDDLKQQIAALTQKAGDGQSAKLVPSPVATPTQP